MNLPVSSMELGTYTGANGMALRYRRWGSGPQRVLLIHGWMVSSVVWEPVAELLRSDSFTVVAPDLRGAGWSDRPREGYSLEVLSDDLIGLMRELGWESVVLVGHSLGAAVAVMTSARARNGEIAGLVLVSPVPVQGLRVTDDVIKAVDESWGKRALVDHLLQYAAGGSLGELHEPLLDTAVACGRAFWHDGFDTIRHGAPTFSHDMVTCRVHVLAAKEDAVIPLSQVKELVTEPLKGTRMQILDGGHYIPVDQPDAIEKAVNDMVREGL